MSEDQSSSPNFFKIGDMTFQNKEGYLADEDGQFIYHYPRDSNPIPIQVKDDPIVNAINRITVNGKKFYQIPKQPKEERFSKVVEAMTDLHRKDGRYATETKNRPFEKSKHNVDSFFRANEHEGLLSFGRPKNYEKFLKVGDIAKLYDVKQRKAMPSKPVVRTVLGKRAEAKKRAVEDHPLVKNWQEQRTAHRGSAYSNKLFQALQYLNLSPEQAVNPTDDKGNLIPQNEKKKWITDRMAEETFEDSTGKKWYFGKRDPVDPKKSSGLVYDLNPPTRSKSGVTFTKRNRKYKLGSQGVRMSLIAVLKGFLEANAVTIGRNPKDSMWALIQPKSKYSKIKMKASEIKAMIDCLKEEHDNIPSSGKDITEMVTVTKSKKHPTGEKPVTFHTEKNDWSDAYGYFVIGLSLGWRREEAFTAQARVLESEDEEQSGVFIKDDEGIFKVRIMTRKTAKVGMKFFGGDVLYGDTGIFAQEWIKDRLKQVKNKVNISKTWYNPDTKEEEPYEQHSLIGYDGKYTEEGTLEFPANAFLSTDEREKLEKDKMMIPQVKAKSPARNRLMAIMRHCYEKVGLTESYWTTNSLHAVRHTFAQLWIKKSGGNYEFVRYWGHWTHLTTLMSHYAGQSNLERRRNADEFNANSLTKLIADEEALAEMDKKKREEAEKSARMDFGEGSLIGKTDELEMTKAGKQDPTLKDDGLTDEDQDIIKTDPDAQFEGEEVKT